MAAFKAFLESPVHLKVFHNYSFDSHVFANNGIYCKVGPGLCVRPSLALLHSPSTPLKVRLLQGLGGDTVHMARLWDTSRTLRGGYKLSALCEDVRSFELMAQRQGRIPSFASISKGCCLCAEAERPLETLQLLGWGKTDMKKVFGRGTLKKDGTEGKLLRLPDSLDLHNSTDKVVFNRYVCRIKASSQS